jgi:hypothetical protein
VAELTRAEKRVRLVENFTATEIVGMLPPEELDRLYGEVARLMEWDE